MADIDRRRVFVPDQFLECLQHFDLRGYIEGCCWFVENQQLGVADHCHCCHQTLQLPSTHLMWITVTNRFRFWQVEFTVKRDGLFRGLIRTH